MEHRGQDRQRLERTLVLLSRQGIARAGRNAPPRGRAVRRPPKRMLEPEQPSSRPEPQLPPAAPAPEAAAAQAAPPAVAEPTLLELELPELDDLVDRLDRLEQKVDAFTPSQLLPATKDAFAEWVRLRRWQEIPFKDFLTLRRAGRI